MPVAKSDCSAGLVTYPDGTQGILVTAGSDDVSSHFLNLETLLWEPKADFPYIVDRAPSVPFQDSFLVVGGYSAAYIRTIHFYDTAADEWKGIANMEEGKRYTAALMVPDSFANCI